MTTKTPEGDGLLKSVAILLMGVVISGAGWVIVEGRTHISRKDAAELIDKVSPYVKDKGTIFTRLDSIDRNLAEIKQLLREKK